MFKKLRFLPILIMVLVMAVIAFSPAGTTEAGNKIADGVFLGDQDLSGKTMNEAADIMEKYYEKIAASDLTINIRNIPDDVLKKMEAGEQVDLSKYKVIRSVKVPVADFDFDYSIEEALRVASTLGQTGKLVERYKTLMDMKYGSAQLPLSYSIDGEKVKEYVEKTFVPDNTKEPVDAKFSWSKGGLTVIQKEQDGIKVNAGLTINAIMQAFEDGISDKMSCSAIVSTTPPSVTSESMKNVAFTKVATYTTQFWRGGDESNASRSHNIDMAAKYFNGTLVMPGQRISTNNVIGKRTVERGFSIGHAYSNGQVIDVVGGGICQFATTLYQCLLQTELQVNVRHAHSMRVVYVDYSQDATLDWGYADLIFTNNWEYPIFIECSTNYNSVTVSFYGVDQREKGRTVEYKTVIDNVKKTVYPEVILDADTAAGYAKVEGESLDAVNSHIEKIVRVNGVIKSTTIMNNDYYRAYRAKVNVGAKGLGLTKVRENEIDQIKDKNGNYLLLNGQYAPIYNGRGGYYLAKDYKHDANNVAVYSGGKLVPIGGGSGTTTNPPTQPPTQPPTTEAPTTEAPTTEAPTEPPTTAHEHTWGEWSAWTHIDKSPSSCYRTRSCTSCSNGTEREEYPCSFQLIDHKEPTTTEAGYNKYECERCHHQYTEEIPMLTTAAPPETTTEAAEPDPNP